MLKMNIMKKKSNIVFVIIILVIVLFSFVYRMNHLLEPKVADHEWHSSTVLRHLKIWEEEGAFTNAFLPTTSYTKDADKFIDNNASNEEQVSAYSDSSGNFYYTSYLPFGYIAPYIVFKIFAIEPTIEAIRVFGMIVHYAIALFVGLAVFVIFKRRDVALISASTYLFIPIAALYHKNNYMSDMLVPLFLAMSTYFFIKIIDEKSHRNRSLILFTISLAMMIYTEWIGVIFAGVVFLYSFYIRNQSYARKLFWISFATPISVIGLSILQFGSVNSAKEFVLVMLNRYVGSYVVIGPEDPFHVIYLHYKAFFFPIVIFSVAFIVLYMIIASSTKTSSGIDLKRWKIFWLAVFISTVPALIHNLVFFHWSAFHQFSVLKTAVGASILLGGMYVFLWEIKGVRNLFNIRMFVTIALMVAFFVSIKTYVTESSLLHRRYTTLWCDVGEQIGDISKDNQVIFIKDRDRGLQHYPVWPQIVTCAERNIQVYRGKLAIRELMNKTGSTEGIMFELVYFANFGAGIVGYEEFDIDSIDEISI